MMVGYFFLGAFLALLLYASDARAFTLMVIGGLLAALIAQVNALKKRLRDIEQQRQPGLYAGLDAGLDAGPSAERPYIVPAVAQPRPYAAPISVSPPARPSVVSSQVDAPVLSHSLIPEIPTATPIAEHSSPLELPPIEWATPDVTNAAPTLAQYSASEPVSTAPTPMLAPKATPILSPEPGWGVPQVPKTPPKVPPKVPSNMDASWEQPRSKPEYAPTAMPPAPELPEWANKLLSFENWPIKLGMLLLLVGLASGYRYLAARGYFNVPIEMRLIAVALAAIAALVFGYGKREEKRSFSLSVQGAALGALLLTVYASFRLYEKLDGPTAFTLMLIIVAVGVVLAVLQDALWLALFATIGGFAAPILASTGSGSHVHLFGYYLILNLGILAIALKKGWRSLNFLGAICTFGIGIGWGANYYSPEFFNTVEPFLLAFFAIYLTITVLYTLRHGAGEPVLDGVLVFGVPLASLGAQAGLLAGQDEKLALSSFGAALIYGGLSYALRTQEQASLLRKCFTVLAVTFFTLAIPLYFSAQITSALWALEGAAVLWLGLRQKRTAPTLLGLCLQGFAWISYFNGYAVMTELPAFWNAKCLGALILALASFTCGWLLDRTAKDEGSIGAQLAPLAWLGALFGLLWWGFAGVSEIDRNVHSSFKPAAMIAWLGLTMLLSACARGALKFDSLRIGALVPLAIIGPVALLATLFGAILAEYRGIAFVSYLITSVISMALLAKPVMQVNSADTARSRNFPDFGLKLAHSLWLIGVCLLVSLAIDSETQALRFGEGLRFGLNMAAFAAVFLMLIRNISAVGMPLQHLFSDPNMGWRLQLTQVWAIGITLALVVGSVIRGDSNPLQFVPLFNPLEITLLGLYALLYLAARDEFGNVSESAKYPLLIMAFWLLTTFTLRAVAQVYDPSLATLGHAFFNRTGQAALALIWSIAGCGAMLLGHARARRPVWFAGAALMGVVLVKMVLVDRHNLGELPGIFTTLGVGALLATVGYFAPVPPGEQSRSEPE